MCDQVSVSRVSATHHLALTTTSMGRNTMKEDAMRAHQGLHVERGSTTPSQVRGAPAQRVAEDRLTNARAPGRPSHNMFFSVSLCGRFEDNCAPRGASRKHRNALLLPVADSSAGQPHPPDGSKCSLTFLGQDSVSGAQAKLGPLLLVGPHEASRQCSQITDIWPTLQALTVQSPNRDVSPAFRQRAQPHPSRNQ